MNPAELKPWLLPLLLKALRYLLVLAGGNLAVSDSQLTEVAGALLVGLGFVWSIIEDKMTKKKAAGGMVSTGAGEKETNTTPPLGLFLVLALFLGFTGCVSHPAAPGTPPSGVADNRAVLAAVKLAAFVGTSEALRQEPSWNEDFRTASDALLLLSTKDALKLSDITSIVLQLPINELKSDRATLYITSASIVLEEYDAGTVDISRVAALRPVITALVEGIELGLKTTR